MSDGGVRSDHQIERAHERRGLHERIRPGIERVCELGQCATKFDLFALRGSGALLQRHEAHPGHAREWCRAAELERTAAHPGLLFSRNVSLPVQSDLQAGQGAQASPPPFHGSGIGCYVGYAAWNGRRLRAESERQTQERTVVIDLWDRLSPREQCAAHRERTHQLAKCRWHLEVHLPRASLEQSNVAAELQRVSKPLLGINQDALALERLAAAPAGWRKAPLVLAQLRKS